MCSSTGWIKIFYRFKEWEWYGDPNMVALFIHLLLRANYKPVRRCGETLGRGVVLTSREELSRETGISERTIRTCLNRLKMTNEVTIKTTKKGSVITITNYDKYQMQNGEADQENAQQSDRQATNDRPTSDQRPTNNNKNLRIIEYIVYDDNAPERTCTRSEFLADFFHPRRQAAIEQLCMNLRIDRETLHRLACEVITEWEVTSQPPHGNISDAQKHLLSSIRIKLQQQRREQSSARPPNETDRKDRLQQRRGTDAPSNRPEDYSAPFQPRHP